MGLLVSSALTAAACAGSAALMDAGRIGVEAVGYAAMGILLASTFLGSVVALRLVRRRRLMVAGIHGAGYYLILLLINGLLYGGAISGAGVTALVILTGSACAVMLPGTQIRGPGRNRQNMVKLYKNSGVGK